MRYEKVIGVGHSCNCKQLIRCHKLSEESYPLDWMDVRVNAIIHCIKNEFEGILDDYEVLLKNPNGKCLQILDKKYNFTSIHDVLADSDFEKEFAEFKSKILRRVERWKQDIRNESICVIRLDNFICEVDKINEMYDVLKSFNSKIHFHYLLRSDLSCDDKLINLHKDILVYRTNFVEWKDIPTDKTYIDYVKKYHCI